MNTNLKRKICWNCETVVSYTQENCNSCSVYLSPSSSFEIENQAHILTPPYHFESQKIYSTESEDNQEEKIATKKSEEIKFDKRALKQVMLTLFFLFLGSIFLLFVAFMLIFSKEGFLKFSLNSNYWSFYLALSFPLLFFGWRGLNRISD